MTTYEITIDLDGIFVTQNIAPGEFLRHGPYKNRKSAVGRISDLKKREVAPIIPLPPAEVTPNAETTIGHMLATAIPGRSQSITETPCVDKIAASSAYGSVDPGWVNPPFDPNRKPFKLDEQSFAKSIDPLAAGMNNLDMSKFKIVFPRPRGVYPAISKHAYQR